MLKKAFYVIVIFFFILFLGCNKDNSYFAPELSNLKIYINEIGFNPSWIELYNDEDSAVNIGGFYLFSDYNKKIKLNSNLIPSKGYIIFNISSNQGNNNLPILINKENGIIYLEEPNKKQVDKLEFSKISDGKSYGRIPDGGVNLIHFDIPTPMQSNFTFLMPNQPPIIKDVTFYPINPNPYQEVTVSAFIFDDHMLTSAKLFYSDNNNAEYESEFTNTCCDPRKLEAKIKGFPINTIVSFYIKATDDSSSVSYFPNGAPTITLSYQVSSIKKGK